MPSVVRSLSLLVMVPPLLSFSVPIMHSNLDVLLGLHRGHLVNHVLRELHPVVTLQSIHYLLLILFIKFE